MDLASSVVSLGIEYGIGSIFKGNIESENKKLVEQLNALDLQQQQELKDKLNAVKKETEKTQILFSFLNQIKAKKEDEAIKKKRIITGILIAIGIAALSVVAIKLKRK